MRLNRLPTWYGPVLKPLKFGPQRGFEVFVFLRRLLLYRCLRLEPQRGEKHCAVILAAENVEIVEDSLVVGKEMVRGKQRDTALLELPGCDDGQPVKALVFPAIDQSRVKMAGRHRQDSVIGPRGRFNVAVGHEPGKCRGDLFGALRR